MNESNRKIADIQAEIDRLNAEKKAFENLTPAQRVALALYEISPNRYADDWPYEVHNGIHDWTRFAHKTLVEKAEKALRLTNGNESMVIEMARILR